MFTDRKVDRFKIRSPFQTRALSRAQRRRGRDDWRDDQEARLPRGDSAGRN